jgi:hypothetical protein
MYFNSIPKILALSCLGSLPALANPPYNPDEPAPPPTVPQGPTPSGVPSNGACCGYELTNRAGAYFRYTHEIDFDKVRLSPAICPGLPLIIFAATVDVPGQCHDRWLGDIPRMASRTIQPFHRKTGHCGRKQYSTYPRPRSALESAE